LVGDYKVVIKSTANNCYNSAFVASGLTGTIHDSYDLLHITSVIKAAVCLTLGNPVEVKSVRQLLGDFDVGTLLLSSIKLPSEYDLFATVERLGAGMA
jgi:hypothetical protein